MTIPRPRSAEFKLLLAFVLFAAGIISAGSSFYWHHKKVYSSEVYRQLSAVAELKVNELSVWREDRESDASIFFKNPSFSSLVRRFFDKPDDVDAHRQLQDWLGKFEAIEDYGRLLLLDTQGVTRLSVPGELQPASAVVIKAASESLRSGQRIIQDFYVNELNQGVYLAVLVPLFDDTEAKRPLGVLVLRILPEKYLYPFMERWPTPSATAETQLVRRDRDEVVFLSGLRGQTNTTYGLRISLKRTEVLAVKAAMGKTGILSGAKDYRGVPVIAAIQAVPDSPWVLVAKIDFAELMAPLHAQLWQLVILIVIMLFGLGTGVMLFWRQERVKFYREKATAAEKLLASEEHHRTILKMAMDAISRVGMDGRLLEVNEAFCRMSGYSTQELLAMHMSDLEADRNIAVTAAHLQKGIAQGEDRFDARYRRKDGSDWDVEISLQYETSNACEFVVFLHDITEHKSTEETLQRQADDLRFRNETLTRFNAVMVGRELRMIELKREVNELRQRLGEPPRYKIVDSIEGDQRVSDESHSLGSLDLQEQAELREKVLELNHELNKLRLQLYEADAEVFALKQSKNQFIRKMAHDLCNPLGVIMAYNEFLLDEAGAHLSSEQKEYIRASIAAAEDMKRIINGFQDVAVSESTI